MTSPIFERVRGIAADILRLPRNQITTQSSPENIAAWDSVQHLNLVLALEQEFSVQFEPEEMDQMSSIDCILAILQSKVNQK
ncbi:MAG: acyl carrier protein [Acidobacteriota bacterium]|nr:acyl carrier protein [Acidobacteriota bacterium]